MRKILFSILSVVLLFSCGNGKVRNAVAVAHDTTNATLPPVVPKEYTFRVLNTYPHSEGAYTQGLIWHQGAFYEGTGMNGESCLKRVELESGMELKRIDLPERYFGEGITMLNDRIYQITWLAGQAFVYDPETFRTLQTFMYDGQGWGLTTDGEVLYMSDGSSEIFVRDAKTFDIIRRINVTAKGKNVSRLNELEWIDGQIWANVYMTDRIVVIDPESGQVTANIDMSGLQAAEDRTERADVLNGIAYDPEERRLFVTGKYWNKLYEIEILEKK